MFELGPFKGPFWDMNEMKDLLFAERVLRKVVTFISPELRKVRILLRTASQEMLTWRQMSLEGEMT